MLDVAVCILSSSFHKTTRGLMVNTACASLHGNYSVTLSVLLWSRGLESVSPISRACRVEYSQNYKLHIKLLLFLHYKEFRISSACIAHKRVLTQTSQDIKTNRK